MTTLRQFDERNPTAAPLLSVVCAVRNGAATLQALLDSVRAQRRPDAEFIVLDGDSTDATWPMVLAHRGVVSAGRSAPDRGIYDAWNQALPLCRGRYVAFIGADDQLACGALQSICEAIGVLDHMDPPELLCGFAVQTRGGLPVALYGERWEPKRLPRRMMIAHVMASHRLDWLRARGGFDASFRASGDYELLLRERAHLRVRTLPTVLVYAADGGASRQHWTPHLENYRARRKNGLGTWLSMRLLLRAAAFEACRSIGLK
jgi:glycosyltransferase involved in cell wall biosynthesis